MGTLLRSILNPIVRIRKEEWPRTLLMFLYFFLTITSYYILKPVRDSAFIHEYGAENLPYAWLLTIVVLPLFVSAYVKFVDFLEKNVLLSSTLIFFIINLGVFWWFAHFQYRWLYAIFFIWVSIFSVMTVTQFWLYANDLFNPREAKRLYGFVGSGGILGGIAGGVITSQLAPVIGTRNLMLVAGFLLLFCVLLINAIWGVERDRKSLPSSEREESGSGAKYGVRKSIRLIFSRKYFLLLVGLICVTKVVSTLVDYQFKNIVQDVFTVLDLRTAFFGKFFAILNAFSFCVQFFLTSFVLRRFGVAVALLLLPVGLAFGSVAILANPFLWSAAFTMLYDGGMNYSLNQSTKEVLYLPVSREHRYRVKPFIDMFAYRIAKGIGSVLILLSVNFFHFNERSLSLVSLGLIVLWIFVVQTMKKEYVNELRAFLTRALPEKTEKHVLKSAVELFGNLLRLVFKGEKQSAALALRLNNAVLEPAFIPYLKQEPKEFPGVIRERLKAGIGAKDPLSVETEIERFLRRTNFEESAGMFRAMGGFLKPGLKTAFSEEEGNIALRVAAVCGSILRENSAEAERLLQTLLEGKENLADEEVASIAERIIRASPQLAPVKETVSRLLTALGAGGPDRETVFKEVQEELSRQGLFLPVLAVFSEDARLPVIYRRNLPFLFLASGHFDVSIFLYRMLSDRDTLARERAINALVEIKLRSPERFFETGYIREEIKKEISNAWKLRKLIRCYRELFRKRSVLDGEAGATFLRAQESRYHETLARIFHLLSFLAEPQDTQIVFHCLTDSSELVKANALELLDNIVPEPDVKQEVFRLLESETAGEEADLSRSDESLNSKGYSESCFEDFFEESDPWYFLSLVCVTLIFRIRRFYPRFSLLCSSQDSFVREVSKLVCYCFEQDEGKD
ncbi:MAG TPA: Npt1/Npt2 family nucleotide transporter [Candidatus Omnitrophota bacterium]|nr:Npt1/Npt2 family nucleotide transporter [Candidatus Omnitrophota bacterium]